MGLHFEVYQDRSGQYRWRLVASNGRRIADSGEGYCRKAGCLGGIELVREAFTAPVRELAPPRKGRKSDGR